MNEDVRLKKLAIMLLSIIMIPLIVSGCSGNEDAALDQLANARESISNRDYPSAESYAETARRYDSGNDEAQILLDYIKYEDDMLLATFWEDDPEAMGYIAPIIHDLHRHDSRFDAPVLVLAAAWEKTEMVKILIEAGADPNYGSDKDGLTALMWACKSFDEQLEMVEILLKAGADPYAQSIYNETPLSIAEEYMNPNVVALIHEYLEKNNNGTTE